MKKVIIFVSMFILICQIVSSAEEVIIVQCAENWQCSEWSECDRGNWPGPRLPQYLTGIPQTRQCEDIRHCNTTRYKQIDSRKCPEPGEGSPTWCGQLITECEYWGECINDLQTRVCVTHACGFIQKTESQGCVSRRCTEDWQCSPWSECSGSAQARICSDANSCGTTASKPTVTQSCAEVCIESWNCGSWSACSEGAQTRACTDNNSCGTTDDKPALTQSCAADCAESWACGSWSACANNKQARKCADENKCNNDKFKPIESQNCVPDIIPPSSATPPVVVAKAMSGIVSGNEGEIVFQMSNVDATHKIEGFLSCAVPSDVMVTSSSNAASGSGAQYLSQTFKLGAAPSEKSMVLKLSSSVEGPKYFSCALNYALYKDDKGYLMNNGQYSQEKKYFTVQAGKDVEFRAKEVTTSVRQEDISASAGKSARWIWGVIIAVVLLVAYLLGKSSRRQAA